MILKMTSLDGTDRLGASIDGGGKGPGLVLGRTDGSFWFWWQTGDVLHGGAGMAATDDGDAAAFGEAVDAAEDNGGLGEAEEESFSSSVSLLGCNSIDI